MTSIQGHVTLIEGHDTATIGSWKTICEIQCIRIKVSNEKRNLVLYILGCLLVQGSHNMKCEHVTAFPTVQLPIPQHLSPELNSLYQIIFINRPAADLSAMI